MFFPVFVRAAQSLVTRLSLTQSARKIRAEVSKRLKTDSDESDSVSTSSKDKTEVKLPRLELPKFSGGLTDWQSFGDRFEALVNQSDLQVISKFNYLQSLHQGEALSVIQGLALTTANYEVACDLLKERFGRPEKINICACSGFTEYLFNTQSKRCRVPVSQRI